MLAKLLRIPVPECYPRPRPPGCFPEGGVGDRGCYPQPGRPRGRRSRAPAGQGPRSARRRRKL